MKVSWRKWPTEVVIRMKLEKGHRKLGGRKRGTPNKLTVGVKRALVLAFAELGDIAGLVRWAKKNDENRAQFYRLWIKLLPKQNRAEVSGQIDQDITVAEEKTIIREVVIMVEKPNGQLENQVIEGDLPSQNALGTI